MKTDPDTLLQGAARGDLLEAEWRRMLAMHDPDRLSPNTILVMRLLFVGASGHMFNLFNRAMELESDLETLAVVAAIRKELDQMFAEGHTAIAAAVQQGKGGPQ